jgi:hypothetical protein
VRGGAQVLLPVGNALNMFLVDHGIKRLGTASVLDMCGTMIKVAELMVDLRRLGIERAGGEDAGVPTKDERARLARLFGAD